MSYICSLSLSLLPGIAIELCERRNVYFGCIPLIRRRADAVERKLKPQERATGCGAAPQKKKKKKDCSPGPPLKMTWNKVLELKPGGRGRAE